MVKIVQCANEDTKLRKQSTTPTSPTLKKAHQLRLHVKVMLTVFFDMEGIVHSEFVSWCQMVNSAFYKEVLQYLRVAV
jgi:hypothetical protein